MSEDIDRAGGILTIELGAISHNWRDLAARSRPAHCGAVVKADGYGLGALAVSEALHRAGCTRFFVAHVDEALALRRALPRVDIFVLHGAPAGAETDLVSHRLIPVLSSLGQLGRWRHAAPVDAPFAFQFDTGMNRLGLSASDIGTLLDGGLWPGPQPVLVMSHLAVAEEEGHPMTACQRSAFAAFLVAFPGVAASLSASSGIFLGRDFLFDLVRPGAALYGVNPCPMTSNPMAQVVRLQAKILQVRDVDSPMTVGYGATHRVARKGRIATISAGYADGVLRSLSNRGSAVLGGVRVPMVGRISMDLITLDVTDVPESAVHEGALADLIGPGLTLDEVAGQAGTIGYEILTSLGNRFARRYLHPEEGHTADA